jgi:hypothetical protein
LRGSRSTRVITAIGIAPQWQSINGVDCDDCEDIASSCCTPLELDELESSEIALDVLLKVTPAISESNDVVSVSVWLSPGDALLTVRSARPASVAGRLAFRSSVCA